MKLALPFLTLLMLFSSCYPEVDENSNLSSHSETTGSESGTEIVLASSRLSVSVMGQCPETATRLLVFAADSTLADSCTLTDGTSAKTFTLPRGRYRLVALSGSEYFPLANDIRQEVRLTYGDTWPRQPLLMGAADVTLASNTATATLFLAPQTAEVTLQPMALQPEITGAQVTLSAIYTEIDLTANLYTPQAVTLPCTCVNGQWSSPTCHLLPSFGTSLVVSLEILANGISQTYGYILPEALKPGGRYQIMPTDNAEITLNGEGPSGNMGQEITLDTLPAAPCLWDSHIIAQVTAQGDTAADLLLLSCNEWEGIHSAYYEADSTEAAVIAASYQEGGPIVGPLADWHIPTKAEATLLRNLFAAEASAEINTLLANAGYPPLSLTDASGSNIRYLCNDALHTFTFASATASNTKAGTKATYYLRLVKTLHVKVKEREIEN